MLYDISVTVKDFMLSVSDHLNMNYKGSTFNSWCMSEIISELLNIYIVEKTLHPLLLSCETYGVKDTFTHNM